MAVWKKPNGFQSHGHNPHTHSRSANNSNSPSVEEGEISSPPPVNGNVNVNMNTNVPSGKPHITSHSPHVPRHQSGNFRSSISKTIIATNSTNGLGGNTTGNANTNLNANANANANANDPEEGEIGFTPPIPHSTNTTTLTNSYGNNSSIPAVHRPSFHNSGGSRRSNWANTSNTNTNPVTTSGTYNASPAKVIKTVFKPKPKPAFVPGSYASLSEVNDKRNDINHTKREASTSSSFAGGGVKNWEPPGRKRPVPGGAAARHHNPPFESRRRNSRPWENVKSPLHKQPWREGHPPHGTHRDGPKTWKQPRVVKPTPLKQNTEWRRTSSVNDVVGGYPNGSGSGSGSVGGSYYGPPKTFSSEDNQSNDYYGTVPNKDAKFSPGARFQPPPGQEKAHAMVNDDGLALKEEGSGSEQHQLPSSKLRMDGSLSTGRGHFDVTPSFGSPRRHASDSKWKQPDKAFKRRSAFTPPSTEQHELEQGQIDLGLEKEGEGAIAKKGPLVPKNGTHGEIVLDEVHASMPAAKVTSLSSDMEMETTPSAQPATIPARLTCASLHGNDAANKAMKTIKILSELMNDDVVNQAETADAVPLPKAEQVTKALEELQKQIKQGQQQLKLIKFKMKQAVREDIAKKKKEEELRKEEETHLAKLNESEETKGRVLLLDAKAEEKKVAQERHNIKQQRLDEMSEAKLSISKFDEKITEAVEANKVSKAIETEKEIMTKYEIIIVNAQKQSQEARACVSESSKALSELETQLKDAEKDLDEGISINALKRDFATRMEANSSKVAEPTELSDQLKGIVDMAVDEPDDMNNLIMSIMRENKQRAAQSQFESVSIVVPEAVNDVSDTISPPGLIQELPDEDELGFKRYIAHWTKMTQCVTGPGDSLYSEPSQAHFYEKTWKQHKEMKPLVKEHIRSKRRKLHHRWTELAEEYAIREQLYEKDSKRDSTSIHSTAFGGSFSICGQRRGGGADDSASSSFSAADGGNSRATNNPYRRPRRSAGLQLAGGDIVRSDYEQEQIILQLTAQENMERRIKLGRSDLPRQICKLEKEITANFKDTMSSRRIYNLLEDQKKHNLINPWSDMEKCIFFDRFLQHPKDFRKIASFLKNKTTHDCIAFYYNSKQSVPYKAALKEHLTRKKKRGDIVSWEATIQAAISLGATVTAGLDSEKPLLFHLPSDDQTYKTRMLHPISLELFNPSVGEITYEEPSEPRPRKKKSALATTFTLEQSARKYLRGEPALYGKRSPSGSDLDSSSSAKLSQSSSLVSIQDAATSVEQKLETSGKKGSNKWSEEEKSVFFDSLKKYGKKWTTISEVIGTKTPTQARNFYYDQKRQNGNSKGSIKEKKEKESKKLKSEKMKEPPPIQASQETQYTEEQIAMHFAQMNNSGGLPTPVPEEKNVSGEGVHGFGQGTTNALSNQVAWHESNRQRQLALAIEQHRRQQQLSDQHRILEHQLARQQIMDQQRQMQQHQHFLGMLNHQQNDMVGGVPHWLASQILQQQQAADPGNSLRDFVDNRGSLPSNAHLNMALAMRQLQHQQQQNNLSMGSGDDHELSVLARIAENASRSNQQNRNR